MYLVAGDEPLLVDDVLEQIRAAARGAGYDERELHVADKNFRWDQLAAGADNLSLFAARRILEIRLASPRPGTDGARTIRGLIERADPDRLLLIAVGARLDAAATQSQWVKAIDGAGALVEVRPVERSALPRWIGERARRYRLKLTGAAAELLAERVEGNLLAADQELMKLSLAGASGELDETQVLESVADSARFDVFRLTDAALAGDARRALRVLAGLRTEGVHPVLVSWALGRDLALLTSLKFAVSSGERAERAFARLRVWRRRQPLMEKALGRFDWPALRGLLAQAAEVDAVVKGAAGAPPWDAVTRLVVAMVGGRQQPGSRAA